jgi:polysaccharide biosynthesis protein PslG
MGASLGRASLLAIALLGLVAVPAAAASPRTAFFGVSPQEPLAVGETAEIGSSGLGLRLAITWGDVEPRPGVYEFAALDSVLAEAAQDAVAVLPVLWGTPGWLSADPARPPLGRRGLVEWRRFLRRLVLRYGSRGRFWNGRAERAPIRRWQLWNEPNFRLFWHPHPSPRGYARLLHAGAAAIRGADPGARIVAAGVAPIEHARTPWGFLRRLYRVPGFRADADVLALHPYTPYSVGVDEEVRRVRLVMARAGDAGKPLLLTEVGVASAASYPTAFDRGPEGQAHFLERVFRRMWEERRRWRIAGVYWFTWKDAPSADRHCSFCEYAGLFERTGAPKPAWWALRRAVSAPAATVR